MQQALDHEAVFAAKSNAVGVPTEVLSAAEVRRRDPGVDYDIAGAVLFAKDAHLDPRKLLAVLTAEVTRLGGRLVFDAEVTGWRTEGDLLRAAEDGRHPVLPRQQVQVRREVLQERWQLEALLQPLLSLLELTQIALQDVCAATHDLSDRRDQLFFVRT